MTRLLVPQLAVVLLAGCSITGATNQVPPKTLSHSRFVHLSDRAFIHFVCGVRRLEKPTTFAQERAYLEKLLSGFEHLLVTDRSLAPPASDANAFEHKLATMDTLDVLLHRLRDAMDAGQVQPFKTLEKRVRRVIARFNSRFPNRHRAHLVCAKK